MRQIITYKGQSLVDIALQEYGDISGVEWLMEDNIIGLSDYIPPGTTLHVRRSVINELVVNELKKRGVIPNSDVSELYGIGKFEIETNFKIY